MNTDIRISISFKGHRKRLRLKHTLGVDPAGYLIDLWISVAESRPDGVLTGWDEVDISLAAGWEGDAVEFATALMDKKHKWLDKSSLGCYFIHDWEENNPWACGAKARSEKAAKAAKARWDKRLEVVEQSLEMPVACSEHTVSILDAMPHLLSVSYPNTTASPDTEPEKSYRTKKGKKLSGKRLEAFLSFWEAFNYKKDKASAADSWLAIPELTNGMVEQVVKAAKSEAKRRPELIQKGQTPKMAQGWLTARRWEDEEHQDPEQKKVYVSL